MSIKIQRRDFLLGFGFLGLMQTNQLKAMVSGSVPNNIPDLSLPLNNVLSLLRMRASLGNVDQTPWHYNGTLYAQKNSDQPIPMIRIEGMESYRVIVLEDGTYEIIGNMLTFFRDLETGEYIDEFKNPITGEINKIKPNTRRASIGRGMNVSSMGVRPTTFIDQMPDKPLLIDWNFGPETVWMQDQTSYPPGLKEPRLQRMTMFAPLSEFTNPDVLSLSSSFTATVLMPWLPWMNMDDYEGHTLWHASGVKLKSIEELPRDYYERMMNGYSQYSKFNVDEDTGPVIYE
jgi:hypothetical protein